MVVVVEVDQVPIVVLRKTVERDRAYLLIGVERRRFCGVIILVLHRFLALHLPLLVPHLIALVEHVDHDLGGVKRGRAPNCTSASVAALLAAGRVPALLDDLHFLVVRAEVDGRVG